MNRSLWLADSFGIGVVCPSIRGLWGVNDAATISTHDIPARRFQRDTHWHDIEQHTSNPTCFLNRSLLPQPRPPKHTKTTNLCDPTIPHLFILDLTCWHMFTLSQSSLLRIPWIDFMRQQLNQLRLGCAWSGWHIVAASNWSGSSGESTSSIGFSLPTSALLGLAGFSIF